ncbi:MAG TPA: FlgD immunoglobulin-like domain containing protein [Armatimonadota bacterium]
MTPVTTLIVCLLAALACAVARAGQPAVGSGIAPRQRPLTLHYTVPADGEVTLGVYNTQGELLRWLTRGDYRYAGKNSETWDGLDQWGKPLAAGSYRIKGITHATLTTEYKMSLGNPGTPPWPTVDNTGDWLSDESNPQAVATDGKWVFLAAPGCEKGASIIAVNEQGRRVWGVAEEFYPRAVSLALSGDYLYALFSGPELTDASGRYQGKGNAVERAILICLDKRTGKMARFSKETARTKVATWPYREEVSKLATLRAAKGYTPGVYGGQPRYFCNDLGESTGALGVAVLNDRVYLAMYYEDKLRVLDALTAKQVDEIPLTKPVGLYAANGALYAVSGTSVVKVDPATKQATPVIPHGLLAPHSLTADAQGNLYVSDWGASFQVKVFSPAGKLLRAIGMPGGRPWVGKWNANGMLVPRGVAVTADGKLWVAEDDETPKRVSVWDARTGAFLGDYLGPTPYGGGTSFWLDPKDPSIVNFAGMRYQVDWVKKTSVPLATTMRKMDVNQVFMPNGHGLFTAGMKQFTHNGREYILGNAYHMVLVLMRQGDVYVPVAAAGGNSRLVTDDGTARQLWDSDLRYHLYRNYYPECFRGHAGDNFSWTDRNGDGLVQAEEMRWAKTLSRGDQYDGRQPEWMSYWGAGIAPDWSLFYGGFCRDKSAYYRLDLQGWTPGGAPIYDITTPKLLATDNKTENILSYYVNAENKLFISYQYDLTWRNPEQRNVLECRDRDGKFLWSVAMPKQFSRKDYHAENIIADFTIPGIGNVLGAWLWHGNYRPYLLTSDGLYLGTMLDDTKIGPQANWDESYRYYFQTSDGTPYLVNGANDALHLLPIRGLEHAKRFETTLTLTEADVQTAAAARGVAVVNAPPKPQLNMSWANTPPTIDGKLDEWQLNAGVALEADGGRGAQIALQRDADTLYLAARVQDSTPLLNKGDDWQKLFITGDCVDLLLATDTNAEAHRRAPVAGDERLLLSVFQDQPIAVRYRPVVPGAKTPVQFMAARIDEVKRLTTARVAYQRGNGYYTLEAAVPLRELGIDPATSETLRGDVGVIFSDETGRNRTLRLYHYNKRTSITADLTTEATLQPGEWGTLPLPLGKNLLRNSSFEDPFVDDNTLGWKVVATRNGATAGLTRDSAHSGAQALLLQQTTPVTFAPEAYTFPDYGNFVKSANGGNGGGYVEVSQVVPVTAGKSYALRVHYRASDLQIEKKQPGTPRGYAASICGVSWGGAPGKPGPQPGGLGVYDTREDAESWVSKLNASSRYVVVPVPYLAPEGAVRAVINFRLITNAAGHLPKAWVDDVEFVEMAD